MLWAWPLTSWLLQHVCGSKLSDVENNAKFHTFGPLWKLGDGWARSPDQLMKLYIRDALADYWLANNWRLTIGQNRLIQKTYSAVLFKLFIQAPIIIRGLLLTWRTAECDKTKMHPKAKLQNAPTFNGNGSHCHVCLLLVIKIKTCTYQLCKLQSADINVLIGRYRGSAKRLIIDRYRLSADRCISTLHTTEPPEYIWWPSTAELLSVVYW